MKPPFGPWRDHYDEDAATYRSRAYEPRLTCPCHGNGLITAIRFGYRMADDRNVQMRCTNAREVTEWP